MSMNLKLLLCYWKKSKGLEFAVPTDEEGGCMTDGAAGICEKFGSGTLSIVCDCTTAAGGGRKSNGFDDGVLVKAVGITDVSTGVGFLVVKNC